MKYLITCMFFCGVSFSTAALHLTQKSAWAELMRLSKADRGNLSGADEGKVSVEETPFEQSLRLAEKGDYVNAVIQFRRLAGEGDNNATFALAMLYRLGLGVAQSNEAARTLFKQAADRDHLSSQVELASFFEDEDPQKALALIQKASAAGLPRANLKLGHCYETGHLGLGKNPQRAFSHYQKAAEAGMSVGKGELARCYDLGIGTSIDSVRATALYRQAASNGVVGAQLALAQRYFEGQGVMQDQKAAVDWLKTAANNGSREAQFQLGDYYEKGNHLPQDYDKAGRYFSAAAKQGSPVARQRLARLFREGKGTSKDPIRAYVVLMPAKGHPLVDRDLRELVESFSPEQLKMAKAKLAQVEARREGVKK